MRAAWHLPDSRMYRRRATRLVAGAVIVLTVMSVSLGVFAPLAMAATQEGSASTWPDSDCIPPEPVLERSKEPLTFRTFHIVRNQELPVDEEVKGIAIGANEVTRYLNGMELDTFPVNFDGQMQFEDVVKAIDDPTWVANFGGGIFESRTGIVLSPGSSLEIKQPGVNEIRLIDRPGMVLGGISAKLLVDGVRITSWDLERARYSETLDGGRPYIYFKEGSTVDIVDSEIIGLGSDRINSYGLLIADAGSSGSLRNSYLAHNFFGVYTSEIDGYVIDGNLFELNVAYGIDPHTGSSNLSITNNVARCNGRHGIIISDQVSNTTITGNMSYRNAVNGIVVDRDSPNARVEGNIVRDNLGDGIVIADSSSSVVVDNEVSGNRIGIRLSLPNTNNVEITANVVSGNQTGYESTEETGEARLNGNQWRDNATVGLIVGGPTSLADEIVKGSPLGLDVRSSASMERVLVVAERDAVLVRSGAIDIADSTITGVERGVVALDNASAVIQGTKLAADKPMGGSVEIVTTRADSVEAGGRAGLASIGLALVAILAALLHKLGRPRTA